MNATRGVAMELYGSFGPITSAARIAPKLRAPVGRLRGHVLALRLARAEVEQGRGLPHRIVSVPLDLERALRTAQAAQWAANGPQTGRKRAAILRTPAYSCGFLRWGQNPVWPRDLLLTTCNL